MRSIERAVLLRTIDNLWIDHLYSMERLRESVRLSGYGQRDPLVEYKREGYTLFQKLLGNIQKDVVSTVFKVQMMQRQESPMENAKAQAANQDEKAQAPKQDKKKTPGRNDPCYCGSGKKFKKCHGA